MILRPALDGKIPEEAELYCKHCGETYYPRYPIPLNIMTAIMEAFCRGHRRCKPRSRAASVQSLRVPKAGSELPSLPSKEPPDE